MIGKGLARAVACQSNSISMSSSSLKKTPSQSFTDIGVGFPSLNSAGTKLCIPKLHLILINNCINDVVFKSYPSCAFICLIIELLIFAILYRFIERSTLPLGLTS